MRPLTVLLLGLLLAGPVLGAEQPVAEVAAGEPITIESDRLETGPGFGEIIFLGSVVARRGDVVIYSDRLTLFYHEGERQLERALAEGGVRIVQGARLATGERADYLVSEERILLTGSPRVQQGENFVAGKEIELFLTEERSVVRGGEQGRVNAVFQPEEKE